MILLAGLVVGIAACIVGGGLAVSCARGYMDLDPADLDDVYCPHCDGTDLDDWGEPGWWACRECHMLFHEGEDQ